MPLSIFAKPSSSFVSIFSLPLSIFAKPSSSFFVIAFSMAYSFSLISLVVPDMASVNRPTDKRLSPTRGSGVPNDG